MSAVTALQSAPDRVARARAVLARAEERTGTRRSPWTGQRNRVGSSEPGSRASAPVASAEPLGALPVDDGLAELLPSGLVRGSTTVVTGSTSLLLTMLARASATGSWVAVVGLASVGLLAAHQLGLALERVVLVPDAGADGPRVLAALLDGMDAVVVGEVALGDRDRHKLSARARERGTVLLATASWPGAHLVVSAQESRWSGVGRGEGRLRDRVMVVTRSGRGSAARSWRGEVRFGGTGHIEGPRSDLDTGFEFARRMG